MFCLKTDRQRSVSRLARNVPQGLNRHDLMLPLLYEKGIDLSGSRFSSFNSQR